MTKRRSIRFNLFKRLTRKGRGSNSTSPSIAQAISSSSVVTDPLSSADTTSVQDSEESLDVLVLSLSEMALIKFNKFPNLPLELRRLVFLYSLSDETRILPVELTLKEADEEFGLYFTFALSPMQRPMPHDAPEDQLDIALLSACKDSRQVYLENNKQILPAGFKRIIRYNPENTIVLIQNFEDLQNHRQLAEGIEKSWRKQKWLSEIKRLAVPIRAFLVEVETVEPIWGDEGHGGIMRVFENLESWIGVIFPGDLLEGREDAQRGHVKVMVDVVRRELESYRKTSNPDYKVPTVEVFEVVVSENIKF
ncbi:hypothetical protein BKA64DRAFT_637477 [Cadophora sp. MPI-SDFR-AT-0126]|nr:hypothetical protein BKA64DRAFT_637477 [Leotiomycetes sp. MPI-SDFR-AT-0126]